MKHLKLCVVCFGALPALSACDGSTTPTRKADTNSAVEVVQLARVPAPSSYAETCRLVGSWCQEATGSIPFSLRRPLRLPRLPVEARCPRTSGEFYNTADAGGIALGVGPVQPLIAGGGEAARRGTLQFRRQSGATWYLVKTLWISRPEYQGPVFIRGRRLDGHGTLVFGATPALVDPQLAPGPTINGSLGFREWPGATWIQVAGCYAWQIDGMTFSNVIVFEAKLVER